MQTGFQKNTPNDGQSDTDSRSFNRKLANEVEINMIRLKNQSEMDKRSVITEEDGASSIQSEKRRRTYGDIPKESTASSKQITRLPPIHSEVTKWFDTMDMRKSGKINAKELQQAFETFQGKHFSESACKFVVRLFDLDKNGGLDVREFEHLYFYIKQWVNAFNAYDRERSGYLDETELDYALKHMDIHFTKDFIKFLIDRSDKNSKRISLDQFIMTCIQIQRYTDEFKARDADYTGEINIKYEDFLEMILRCF